MTLNSLCLGNLQVEMLPCVEPTFLISGFFLTGAGLTFSAEHILQSWVIVGINLVAAFSISNLSNLNVNNVKNVTFFPNPAILKKRFGDVF